MFIPPRSDAFESSSGLEHGKIIEGLADDLHADRDSIRREIARNGGNGQIVNHIERES